MFPSSLGLAGTGNVRLARQIIAVVLTLVVFVGLSGTHPAAAQGGIEPIDLPIEFTQCDLAWAVYNYASDMELHYSPAEAEYWYWRERADRAERFLERHCGADIGS